MHSLLQVLIELFMTIVLSIYVIGLVYGILYFIFSGIANCVRRCFRKVRGTGRQHDQSTHIANRGHAISAPDENNHQALRDMHLQHIIQENQRQFNEQALHDSMNTSERCSRENTEALCRGADYVHETAASQSFSFPDSPMDSFSSCGDSWSCGGFPLF